MRRILFEKTGNGKWISHLDLMRVFQRAFRRAGMPLQHTQGFNPHAFVSIVMPLSVGASSDCELLEFELAAQEALPAQLCERLNSALPDGVRCLLAYEGEKKVRELTYLRARVTLEYDMGVPDGAVAEIAALLARESVVVEKNSKKGLVALDIRPMIREIALCQPDANTVVLESVVCAQNPSLNPGLLAAAVARYLPALTPDFSATHRVEIYDAQMKIFR